jgi:hypothetical protein
MVVLVLLACVVGLLSFFGPVMNLISERQAMNQSFYPFHLVNTYGAFGSITRTRNEIIIEGTSDPTITDTTEWKPYEFKGKPGDPARRPRQIAPYHLRLDWLMWFAAFSTPEQHPWFSSLLAHLLAGDKDTLSLLANNPFPDRPPQWIRARYYDYRFTTPEERRRTGQWWIRRDAGLYMPPVRLQRPS